MKNILVDMSATIIHHGHINLLKYASTLGSVTVALTTDDEIVAHKGYHPELDFLSRKIILESIRYVDCVLPSPWLLTQEYFDSTGCDFLLHGSDNSNIIDPSRLLLVPRTEGISSSIIRKRVVDVILAKAHLNDF